MSGLIVLTGVDDAKFYINPFYLPIFTESTAEMLHMVGARPDKLIPNSSIVIVSGIPIQVKESPKQIVEAINDLEDRQIKKIKEIKKGLDKENWQINDDEYEDYDEDYDEEL